MKKNKMSEKTIKSGPLECFVDQGEIRLPNEVVPYYIIEPNTPLDNDLNLTSYRLDTDEEEEVLLVDCYCTKTFCNCDSVTFFFVNKCNYNRVLGFCCINLGLLEPELFGRIITIESFEQVPIDQMTKKVVAKLKKDPSFLGEINKRSTKMMRIPSNAVESKDRENSLH